MRIAIVFNPRSGPRAASRALSATVAALASHNHVLEVIDSSTQPDFERHIHSLADTFDRVIVIGGDGTLNGIVNAIVTSTNPEVPVALVPTGRGKDASRSLPCWKPGLMVAGAFELADVTPVDLIRITLANDTVRYGINAADIGLPARSGAVANTLPRMLGSLSYILGAARGIFPRQPFTLRMTIDGTAHIIENTLLLSICNGRAYGGGIYIAPNANNHDGLLDIVVAHNAHLGDLALQLPKLKSGVPFDHPALMRWQAKSVTVETTKNKWFDVDGEVLSTQPVRFEIAPYALNWVKP